MNMPINPGPGFNQVLDVLRNEIVTYDLAAGHGKFTETPATGEWEAKVKRLHSRIDRTHRGIGRHVADQVF